MTPRQGAGARSAELLLLATVFLYALNFTTVKYGLDNGFGSLVYASLRFVGGALVFVALAGARERTFRIERRDVPAIAFMALVGIFGNQLCLVIGLRHAAASTFALLFGTFPIWVALWSRVAGLESLRRRHLVAALISFAGVALVALGGEHGIDGDFVGIALALGAPATWAMYSVAAGRVVASYSPYRLSAVVLVLGVVPLVAAGGPELAHQDWGAPNALAWLSLASSIVLSLVVSNITWFRAIDRVKSARASLYANLTPFVGAVLALVLLSESFGPLQVVGGIVIAVGILVVRRRQAATAPE
ncbi:MAG: DMT family transporter [Thermoleophilia bacterium]